MTLKPLDLMVDSFDSLCDSDLDQLEADLSISLPLSYREFLLAHNGGRFEDTVVYPIPGDEEDRRVSWFYSIGSEDDRFDIRKCGGGKWSGVRQPNYLSIADCDRGEVSLYVARGPHFGKVVDIDTAKALRRREDIDPLAGFSIVADDFQGFLNLLDFWVDEDEPESEDHPAFDAASRGDLAAVRDFVDAGFDLNTKNQRGWTMLTLAVGRPLMMTYLLANGADVHAVDRDGRQALLHSCACFETSKILLEHGANPNCRSNSWQSAPILEANDLRILKLLIAYGADLTVRAKDGTGVFDLWKGASKGNRRLVLQTLIDAGYNVEPELDRLIHTLRQYTGGGHPGRKVRGAEMRRIANKIAEIGNELVETCKVLGALGQRAERAAPTLEAILHLVPKSQKSLIEATLEEIHGR